MRDFVVYFTTSCEDPQVDVLGFTFDRRRLDETGTFHYEFRNEDLFAYSVYIDGTVRFRSAEGTFEFNYPTLTEEDQAHLCTTGVLDWSAERVRSVPAGPSPSSSDGRLLTVDRRGELTVAER